MHIPYDRLVTDLENLEIGATDSYLKAYPEFIKYFQFEGPIERHHLIIASHFTYGWMPRVLTLHPHDETLVLSLLNRARNFEALAKSELEILKAAINKSVVGVSKLLHFIRPELYAIWDSHICRYVTGSGSYNKVNKVPSYLQYLREVERITAQPEFETLYAAIQDRTNSQISRVRALELLMFEASRMKARRLKSTQAK